MFSNVRACKNKNTSEIIARFQVEYGQFVITLVGDESNDCHKAFDVIPNAGYRTTIVKISVVDPARLNYDEGTCNDVILKVTVPCHCFVNFIQRLF